MKIRATNEALAELAVNLVSEPNHTDFEFFDKLDDVSLQTLNTLVSQCPYCGDWNRLEDGDCPCSHSEQQHWYHENPEFEAQMAWNESSDWTFLDEVDELPEA